MRGYRFAIFPRAFVLAGQALAQPRQVAAEIAQLEDRAQTCAIIASALDFKLERIETALPGLRGLGVGARDALRRELILARQRIGGADDCDAELEALSDSVDGMIGNAAGNSASGNEMLELIVLQDRYAAARAQVELHYGARHRDRTDRLERLESRAETFLD